MRAFAWLLVVVGPLIGAAGTLMAREDMRALGELCRRGTVAACLDSSSTAYARVGWLIGVGVLAFGILLLAIRRPEPRERDDYLRRAL